MRAYFQEMNELLRQINKAVVEYDLCRLDPKSENEYRSRMVQKLTELEAEKMRQGLEVQIEDAFKRLHYVKSVADRHVNSLSTESAQDIIDAARTAVDEAGLLEMGFSHLQRLKKQIIRHQQSIYMQNVRQLKTLVNVSRGLISPGGMVEEELHQDKQECCMELVDMLNEDNPDNSLDYLLKSSRMYFDFKDPDRFAILVEALEKRIFGWCITPSIDVGEEEDTNGFDPDMYDYVRLLHQMEEMGFRLLSVQKSWEDLLVSVFLTDDPNETIRNSQDTLEHIRANIGSKDLLDIIRENKLDIGRRIREISLKGPRHLELVNSYIKRLTREIQSRVFGKSVPVARQDSADRYIFVAEPRKFVECNKHLMAQFGFPKPDLEIMADRVYGIMSTYTQYKIPPVTYIGRIKGYEDVGRLYIANRFWVIDFYESKESIPSALLEAYTYGSRDDARFKEMLQKADLPVGAGHVRKAYHVIFSEDFRYFKRVAARDRSGKKAIHVTPIGLEEPTHQEINSFVSRNPRNSLMTQDEFLKIRDQLFR